MCGSREVPSDTLAEITYLTRSKNRAKLLVTLAATTPRPGQFPSGYSRRELADVTGASQPTLSRILTEFEERGWAERTTEGEYVPTPFGAHLADEFESFVSSVDVLRDLGEVAAILPTTELSIDRRHFGDATVRRLGGPQPIAFRRYLADLLRDGSASFYVLSKDPGPATPGSEAHDRIVAGHLDYVLINPGHIHEYFTDIPEAMETGLEQVEAGAEYYIYDGEVPCNLFILDEVVVIENGHAADDGSRAVIESRNETVRTWALELFERYREGATKLTVEDLS